MDRLPLDRFPSDPSSATTLSSSQAAMPPPSQTSFRSSDEPDPFKISFLKHPKRKRLAKACDACHKSKRRCDGTAPCSNCYFAAKDCTYTDSSGRPVPAPLASKTDKPARAGPSRRRPQKDSYLESPVSATREEPLTSPRSPSDSRDDYAERSKRPRLASASFPVPESQAPVPLAPRSTFATTRFEVPVVRELVNLFFTHCHPHRLVIHQPTFMADVSLGRIPPYLTYALCALAAPFSKQPAVRTDSPRDAGVAYSKAAEELMFDTHGHLSVDRNIMTVQALCLLESHQSLLSWPWPSPSTHHQLAMCILKADLHVQDEHHHSNLASTPTSGFAPNAIGRECARRAFWYVRLMHLTTFAYYQIPAPPIPMDSNLPLPIDEASFEFGAHNIQPEYLHVPAPRTRYASEYGHLLRIASVHGRLEAALNAVDGTVTLFLSPISVPSFFSYPCPGALIARLTAHDAAEVALEETEKEISTWESSLADHIRFNEEAATLHLAMFETSSNAGAWCYFMMHTLYAWCVLALSEGKARGSGAVVNGRREWARDRLVLIGTKLGSRSKNSVLVVAILCALHKFGMGDHPQALAWMREYSETCGMELPTKFTSRMPVREAFASASRLRLTLPSPVTPTPTSATSVDRVEDRSDASSAGSSGTYFSSLFNSYNKLRINNPEPAGPSAPGSATSLPSLKSCGLLESWTHHPQPHSQHPQDTAGMSESSTKSPTPPWMAVRRATLPKDSAAGPSETTTSESPSTSSRSTKSTPVGLGWLAHER
ncbi:hypothetical protein BJV78DRAFT_586707 [Lactifluus subvellereus]|nr:hypothetical protein BJV78DRAFT_586707 [Lactifluus subvellereus]